MRCQFRQVTGSDGIFNEGDYLLFYAQGTGRWNYNQTTTEYDYLHHNYSDTAFYFITSGPAPGKQITIYSQPSLPANYTSSESDALFVHERIMKTLLNQEENGFRRFRQFI